MTGHNTICYAGVDLGGANLALALGEPDGKIFADTNCDTHAERRDAPSPRSHLRSERDPSGRNSPGGATGHGIERIKMMSETYQYSDIAKMIDHSLLNPSLRAAELEDGCLLARAYDAASVCILPYYVWRCKELLAGSTVHVSTTIGFPHGGHVTAIKVAEARQALTDGATELDMVINISKARSGDWRYVEQEIRVLCGVTHDAGARLKVIFENAYHDTAAKIRLCEICGAIGVDWVKTSTGYAPSGATMDDLRLMRKHSPPAVQVKAAGGIRDLDSLLAVRELGVTRVGATRTAAMLDSGRERLGLPLIAYQSTVPAGY